MPIQGKIIIIFVSLMVLLFVFELLRRKKITEAVTLWWVFIVVGLIVMTILDRLISDITTYIGAGFPITTMILFGMIFIFIMLVYFSMKICVLSSQVKDLAQYIAILKAEILAGKYNREREIE
ncbi:DUF2304 domain-containing protein [Candidatus Margulisiibacteriota bacterium]